MSQGSAVRIPDGRGHGALSGVTVPGDAPVKPLFTSWLGGKLLFFFADTQEFTTWGVSTRGL